MFIFFFHIYIQFSGARKISFHAKIKSKSFTKYLQNPKHQAQIFWKFKHQIAAKSKAYFNSTTTTTKNPSYRQKCKVWYGANQAENLCCIPLYFGGKGGTGGAPAHPGFFHFLPKTIQFHTLTPFFISWRNMWICVRINSKYAVKRKEKAKGERKRKLTEKYIQTKVYKDSNSSKERGQQIELSK